MYKIKNIYIPDKNKINQLKNINTILQSLLKEFAKEKTIERLYILCLTVDSIFHNSNGECVSLKLLIQGPQNLT